MSSQFISFPPQPLGEREKINKKYKQREKEGGRERRNLV